MKKAGIALAFALATHTLWASGPMEHLRREETLAKLNLSAPELKQVISGVEAAAFDSPASWEKELRARKISLGAVPGLVLQGTDLLCGATGNCQIFVFRRTGDKWLALFEGEEAPVVEGFNFGPDGNRGIKDLHIAANISADRSSHKTYCFDGKFYRAVK